jgi:hypothetical protein
MGRDVDFYLVRVLTMNRFLSFSLAVVTGFFMLVATSKNAYGYVDPGSGLLALQTFASVMAACGFFLRKRFKGLFGMKSQAETPAVAEKTDSANAA